jgi:hypothetical protein
MSQKKIVMHLIINVIIGVQSFKCLILIIMLFQVDLLFIFLYLNVVLNQIEIYQYKTLILVEQNLDS